ncbi:MAG: GNAT family N-acetyltransferase [Pseudomonadota bacterium]
MLTIRPVSQDDHAEWRRLWTKYLEFYETAVAEDVYVTTWERLHSDDPNEFNCFVADYDGALVGLTHYLFHRHCWKIEQVCYLQDLYVDEEVRGTGAGRALIEAVYRAADEAGAPSVYWLTQDFNETARRLYDRIGKQTPFIRYNR